MHVIAMFALIYVGVEVTMGGTSYCHLLSADVAELSGDSSGWSVTYILEERHGNSSSGYIASGFFGGRWCRAPSDAPGTYARLRVDARAGVAHVVEQAGTLTAKTTFDIFLIVT